MAKPEPKFYVQDPEHVSDEDPDKTDTQMGKSALEKTVDASVDQSRLLDESAAFIQLTGADNYIEQGPFDGGGNTKCSLAVNMGSRHDENFSLHAQDINPFEAAPVRKRKKKKKCIPSTNQDYGDLEVTETDERSVLLDLSNDIEQCSDDWPIDPDRQSEIFSNMTEKRLHLLGNGSAQPKQLLMELFLLVNMAQLMYVAALSFYKILIVSEGISIAEICMYRFGILFTIESLKYTCCGTCLNLDEGSSATYRDSSPRAEEELREEDSDIGYARVTNRMLVTIVYCIQAVLTTVGILAVLVGVKTLPLCYVMIGLNLTNLVFTAIGNLENSRMRDSTTYGGLLLVMIASICAFSSIRILGEPETIAEKLKDASDPLIQMIQINTSETFAGSNEFIIGLCATLISGFCFSMSTSLNKTRLISSESSESQTFVVLTICCILAATSMMVTRLKSDKSLKESIESDSFLGNFFWIGVFSITDKAAIQLSFHKQQTRTKVMCLVGILYSFIVDRSLFSYQFQFIHVEAGACVVVLTIAAIMMQPKPESKSLKEEIQWQSGLDLIM